MRVDASLKASGIIALMEKFSNYFGLRLGFLLFGATKQALKVLQYKDNCAQDAISVIKSTVSFLN